jgi:hypothetical protein
MLTRKSLELLMDLVENKLDTLEIFDRDDRRVLRDLETCRGELAALRAPANSAQRLPAAA